MSRAASLQAVIQNRLGWHLRARGCLGIGGVELWLWLDRFNTSVSENTLNAI